MRFLVDESTGPAVAHWLEQQQHEAFSVYDEARGADDDWIIERAAREDWILITNDKDFGEKVFREHRLHRGIILLRLQDERAANKIEVLRRFLEQHAAQVAGRFAGVTDWQVRFAGLGSPN